MKKSEKRMSLRWLLCIAAVVALCLGILLVGCGKKEEAPAADDSNHVQLYWNVDRMEYVAGNADGTSGRYPRGDGFYYIRLAAGGEQKDYMVEDYGVVNRIELVDCFMPIFDDRGVIVDIKTVGECTGGFLAPSLYVKSVDGNTVHANTQGTFLGIDMDFTIDEETEVYDVGGGGILTGILGQIEEDDEIIVIKDLDGTIGTVFVKGYEPVGDIYWNIHRKYDSTSKTTTREADAMGYYVFELALNGEVVTARTRDYKLANNIDSVAAKCFALTFDENGDIKTREGTSYAGISATFGSWYHVTDINGSTVTAERIAAGSDQGNVMEAVMSKDCKVIDVSSLGGYSGQITELRVGDQIHGLRDGRGRIAYIFVHNRAPSADLGFNLYYNLERKYSSTTLETTRLPDGEGWYYVKVLLDGQQVTVKSKDKALVTELDAISNSVLALKVDENGVFTDVESGYGFFGGSSVGAYYYIDELNGANFHAWHTSGGKMNGTISADTVIYDVSDAAGRKGELTELQLEDRIIGVGDLRKNIRVIYVVKRAADVPMYWNLTRNYSSTTKETTKKPDADGFYWFTFACNGEQVKLKTREKAIATKIDSNAALCCGLCTNGDEITKVVGATSIKGYTGGTKSVSWVDVNVVEKGPNGTYVVAQKNQAGHAQDGMIFEVVVGKGAKIYDVSSGYVEFAGEPTDIRVGDRIAAYHNSDGIAMAVWIVGGRTKPVNPNPSDCPCETVTEWTPWDGTTELEDGKHYYLTSDVYAPNEGFIIENMSVHIRLDGHNIISDGRVFYTQAGGFLNVCDHGTRGKLIGSGVSGESGGVVRVYTGTNGAGINAWNIDIEYKDAGHPAKEGGAVSCAGFGSFYDVNIIGGVSSGKGGNVTISMYGNFRMFGGSAVNGNAKGGNGGNINSEGIIYLEDVTLSGGKATGNGKDVYFGGASYAKRIKNLTLNSGNAGMYLNSGKLELDGTVNVTMTMGADATLHNVGLTTDSKITLKKNSAGTVLSGANTDLTGLFVNTDTTGDYVLKYDSKKKEVYMEYTVVPTPHGGDHCACVGVDTGLGSHSCETLTGWTEITDAVFETAYGTGGESRGIKFKKDGNYYLTQPYTLKSGLCIMPDQEIVICLNGNRLTGSNQAGRVAGTLTITDCVGDGKLTSLADATNGNTIKVLAGGEFNLYAGTLTAEASCTDGGVIAVTMDKGGIAPADSTEPGVMNMYGGTITGGVAKGGGNMIVWHSSIFNMYGGVIEKGTSTSAGDNIRVAGSGVVVNLLGGIVRDGNIGFSGGKMYIGGNIQITDLIPGGQGVFVHSAGLGANAKIAVEAPAAGTLVGGVKASDFSKFEFINVGENITVEHDGSDIVAKYESTHKHCVCGGVTATGHSCETENWMPLSSETIASYFSVSSSRYVANSSELYLYLTEDLDLTYSINLNVGQTIHLCLSGFDLKHSKTANPVMRVWGDLDITDCSADRDGQIIGYRTGESPCLYIQNWVTGSTWASPTVNLFAGTLTAKDGNSSTNAGVIQLGNKVNPDDPNLATLNMYGGKICGGHGKLGGNLYIHNENCVFNMFGGEIIGGTTSSYGADIYSPSSASVTLGGTITIGEYYSNAIVLKLKDLNAASSIGILRNTEGVGLFATGATTDVSACFKNSKLTAVWNSADKTLTFTEATPEPPPVVESSHKHCICVGVKPEGHTCTEAGFIELKKADFTGATATSSPVYTWNDSGTNSYALKDGYYFLGEDITGLAYTLNIPEGGNVVLCLNGKTYKAISRAIFTKGTVTITDCSSGMTGTVTSTTGTHAPALYARTGADVTIYAGNFQGTKMDSTAAMGGACIAVGGELTMYGGKISGGDASAVSKNGGNMVIADGGIFKMYGGSIEGGTVKTSQSGGNIRIDKGTMYLYGGIIKDGTGKEGGNIAIGSNGTMHISGGTIENGRVTDNGGNLAVFGVLNISGGVIKNGVAGINGKTDATGGNITTYANKTNVTITGGVIENGVAPRGANLALRTTASVTIYFTMTGGEIRGGDGKSVYVVDMAKISVTLGGTAKIDTLYFVGTAAPAVKISTAKPIASGFSVGLAASAARTVVTGITDTTGFAAVDGKSIYAEDGDLKIG